MATDENSLFDVPRALACAAPMQCRSECHSDVLDCGEGIIQEFRETLKVFFVSLCLVWRGHVTEWDESPRWKPLGSYQFDPIGYNCRYTSAVLIINSLP
jgi:hypothetical protein